jgi:hypothetical protein
VELKTDLRRLHQAIRYSEQNCDICRRRNSLKPKHTAVQTDEVKDEDFLMAGGVGSGIIRVYVLIHTVMEFKYFPPVNNFKYAEINLGGGFKDSLWFLHHKSVTECHSKRTYNAKICTVVSVSRNSF